jgi:hypothetical protein
LRGEHFLGILGHVRGVDFAGAVYNKQFIDVFLDASGPIA